MKKWKEYELEDLKNKSKDVVKLLHLPLFDDILNNKNFGLKIRTVKNNILGQIPNEEKDRAFGFLIKSPSLMTR